MGQRPPLIFLFEVALHAFQIGRRQPSMNLMYTAFAQVVIICDTSFVAFCWLMLAHTSKQLALALMQGSCVQLR